jgi:hypothetical protein
MSSIQPSQKKKKRADEMLNCGPTTYTVNTMKIEYLPLGKPTAANILTLLVWRRELSFYPNMSHLFNLQHKHLHCK